MKTFTSIIVLLLSHVNGYTLNYIELFANKVTPIALEVDAGLGMDTLTFTIEECVNAAVEQSGLAGFDQNFSEIASLHKQIADSYKLPVLQLSGQYTYQSEVVSLPDNPVFSTPEIPKNQGKVYLEAQQVLYNGKRATKSGALEQGNVEIQKKEWERDMEQLEDAVRELYYALLLSRKQVDILGRTAEETSRQREIVAVWVENGIKSAIDLYKFDLLLLQQKRTISESRSRVKQLSVQMEGITGLDITGAKLQEPKNVWPDKPSSWETNEVQLLGLQQTKLDLQHDLLASSRSPVVGLFLQAGVGQPHPLNFFNTDLSGYYLGGIRLNWTIWDFNKTTSSLRINQVYREQLDHRRDFLNDKNDREYVMKSQQYEELQELMVLDQQTVNLQQKITDLSLQQFEEGLISSTQYLDEKTRMDLALIQMEMRELQIGKIIYEANQLIN